MKKYFWSALIALIIFFLITINADVSYAADDFKYSVKNGVLTISGDGVMPENLNFGKNPETKNVTKVVINEGITTVSEKAFMNCKKLKSVSFPSTLWKIGSFSFSGTALKSVTIPNSVKLIGNHAFDKCENLKKVKAPADIRVYDVDDFDVAYPNDPVLDSLTFTSDIPARGLTSDHFRTKKYIVPESDENYSSYKGAIYSKDGKKLIRVPMNAESFKINPKCEEFNINALASYLGDDYYIAASKISKIVIPKTVKKITGGNEAITKNGLMKNTSFVVDTTNLDIESISKLTYFFGGKEAAELMLEDVEVKDGFVIIRGEYLHSIIENYFANKDTVIIPEGVKTIAANCFFMGDMKEVVFPESIECIEDYAFYYCEKMEKINFPDGLKEIGHDAFYNSKIQSFVPEKWEDSKEDFCDTIENIVNKNNEFEKSHRNAKVIECTVKEVDYFVGTYNYNKSMAGEKVCFVMKDEGIFYLHTSNGEKENLLYDKDGNKVNNCCYVKVGDEIYLQLPDSFKSFKIYDACIKKVDNDEFRLGGMDQWVYCDGKKQYVNFTIDDRERVYFRIADLNLVENPDIAFYIQKKTADGWERITEKKSYTGVRRWYKNFAGSTCRKYEFAFDEGEYRLVINAKQGTVLTVDGSWYINEDIPNMTYGTTRETAVKLWETDYHWGTIYVEKYRRGMYTYDDSDDIRWYCFKKSDERKGILEIEHDALNSGDLNVSIYKDTDDKPMKSFTVDETSANQNLGDKWNDAGKISVKLTTPGVYYVKVYRTKKTTVGEYGVRFYQE